MSPITGDSLCRRKHFGVCLQGALCVSYPGDLEKSPVTITANDAFEIGPDHDAEVTSEDPCVLVMFECAACSQREDLREAVAGYTFFRECGCCDM